MWRFLLPKRKTAVTKEEITYKDLNNEIPTVAKEDFDVVLKVDGKSFKLHRHVLSVSSNFFNIMFSTDMMEREMKEIKIDAIKSSDFKSLVNFMYTGEITISKENAVNLWITSDYLQIINVSKVAANFLTEQLKREIRSEKHDRSFYDVLNIRHRANLLQYRSLYATTNKFIAFNLEDFSKSNEFKSMQNDKFIDLIKSDDLIVHCTKEAIYEACMKWIHHDQKERLPKKEEVIALLHSREHNHRKIFVYGSYYESFEIYDNLKEQQYTREYSPRLGHSAVVMLGDIIYCCGGQDSLGKVVNSVESYDPDRNIWKPVVPMTEERESACAVALNGFIYVMGGRNHSISSLNSVERYDSVKNSWEVVKPMNKPQSSFQAIVIKDKIYVTVNCAIFDCYDPETNTWQMLPHTIGIRYFACAVSLNDYIYVLGGVTDTDKESKSVERYDPERNCWEAVKPMINGGINIQATVLQGKIYAFTIDEVPEKEGLIRPVEIYESAIERWVEGPPVLSKCRFFNNSGVSHQTDSVKIYDPTTIYDPNDG